MKADRLNTKIVLIDLRYHDSMNAFEYFFGDHVSYQEFEQRSYIEFKDIMFDKINKSIKFRKFGRLGNVLTIKADMLDKEISTLTKMLENDEIKFLYEWIISKITLITDNNLPENYKNFKKAKLKELNLDSFKDPEAKKAIEMDGSELPDDDDLMEDEELDEEEE